MGAAKRSLPNHHGTGAFYRKVIALGSLPLIFVHVIIFGGRQKYVHLSQSCVSQCLPFNRDFAGLWLQFQRHLGADKARGIAWSCCHRWPDIIIFIIMIKNNNNTNIIIQEPCVIVYQVFCQISSHDHVLWGSWWIGAGISQ